MSFSEVLLWLFVLNLGIVAGAGLYEARVVVPLWASAPPESLRSPDSGRRFWAIATTGALTLLCLANLVAAWLDEGPHRRWWLSAAIVIAVERLWTFSYFIPTLLRLQRSSLPQETVRRAFERWSGYNWLRNALTLVGWVLALQALMQGEAN